MQTRSCGGPEGGEAARLHRRGRRRRVVYEPAASAAQGAPVAQPARPKVNRSRDHYGRGIRFTASRSAFVPSVSPSCASSPAAWTAVPTRSVPLGGLGGRLGDGGVAGGLRGGGGPDAGGLATCGRGSGRLRGALGARAGGLRRGRLGRRARRTLGLVAAAARPPPAGALGPRPGEGRHHVAASARAGPVAGVWLLGAHLRHMIAHSARRRRRRLKRKRTGVETIRVRATAPRKRMPPVNSRRNLKRIQALHVVLQAHYVLGPAAPSKRPDFAGTVVDFKK